MVPVPRTVKNKNISATIVLINLMHLSLSQNLSPSCVHPGLTVIGAFLHHGEYNHQVDGAKERRARVSPQRTTYGAVHTDSQGFGIQLRLSRGAGRSAPAAWQLGRMICRSSSRPCAQRSPAAPHPPPPNKSPRILGAPAATALSRSSKPSFRSARHAAPPPAATRFSNSSIDNIAIP